MNIGILVEIFILSNFVKSNLSPLTNDIPLSPLTLSSRGNDN